MDGGKRKLGRAEEDKNAKRVRKYEDKFIEFGFTYVVEGDNDGSNNNLTVKVLLDPDAIPVSTRNSKTAHE